MYGCFIDDPRPYGLLVSPMYGEALARENEWRLALPEAAPEELPQHHRKGGKKRPITEQEIADMVAKIKRLREEELQELTNYIDNPPMIENKSGKMIVDPACYQARVLARRRIKKLTLEPWQHREYKKTRHELKTFREARRRGLL